MHFRISGAHWPKTLWKILRNPTLDVVVGILLVLFVAWFLIQTAVEERIPSVPVPFGYK